MSLVKEVQLRSPAAAQLLFGKPYQKGTCQIECSGTLAALARDREWSLINAGAQGLTIGIEDLPLQDGTTAPGQVLLTWASIVSLGFSPAGDVQVATPRPVVLEGSAAPSGELAVRKTSRAAVKPQRKAQ